MTKYGNSSEGHDNVEVVISGSFRKHLEQVADTKDRLEKAGIHVRAPKSGTSTDPEQEFVLLIGDDPEAEPVELEKDFFAISVKLNFCMWLMLEAM